MGYKQFVKIQLSLLIFSLKPVKKKFIVIDLHEISRKQNYNDQRKPAEYQLTRFIMG